MATEREGAAGCRAEELGSARVRSALEGIGAWEGLRSALRRAGVGEAWLVGGFLRDLACGSIASPWDVDITLPDRAEEAARELASGLGGTAFALAEEQGAWRVALPGADRVDVVAFRAPTLREDLRGRDFTINAVAFDLLGDRGLYDPLGGLGHLREGRLVLCSPGAFAADPLRALRAYRFSLGLGLEPDAALSERLQAAAPSLRAVAPERVRTELFAILNLPRGARALRSMEARGVLRVIFPQIEAWRGFDQGDYHAYDLLEHSLRAAEEVEDLIARPSTPGWVGEHLAKELEAGLSRAALLKLAAFLHDLAKPDTLSIHGTRRRFLTHDVQGGKHIRKVLEELRVGRRARAAAQRVVAAHLRLFSLASQNPPTKTARLRYLRDLQAEVPEAVSLALADEAATGPAAPSLAAVQRTAGELLELWHAQRMKGPVEPLVRGRDLVKLGVPEGPRVGELLRRIAEAEAKGEVKNRRQALELARRLL